MFEQYEKLTGGALSGYICELTLQGYADNEIATLLCTRWAYLFNGLSFYDWLDIISEYRKYCSSEGKPSASNSVGKREYYSGGKLCNASVFYPCNKYKEQGS